MKLKGLICALALTATLGACDLFTGPDRPTGSVSLSFVVPGTGAAASAARLFGAGEYTAMDGTNTLVIQSAHLVLREIEFELADEPSGCDADEGEDGSDDDGCEDYETGPILVTLPLDGTVDIQITAELPYGTYDEIEFEVHKVKSSGDAADQAFLDANLGYAGVSVRVVGSWNTVPFEYTSDLNEDQEIQLATPLVVDENSGPVNVTFSIDVDSWVWDASGTALMDPNGDDNWKHNIKNSIEGFEDHDHDGEADDGGAGA